MTDNRETIVAQITPVGPGAIGVIRLSGPDAYKIASHIFRGKITTPRLAYYGQLVDPSSHLILDDALVLWMKAPHSFTGEDVVEFSCHGNQWIINRVIQSLINQGARVAGPGEFSRRAYLNGKMNLTQAEAVCDLINAQTEQMAQASLKQLDGFLARLIGDMREKIVAMMSEIEAGFDFTEEDIQFFDRQAGLKTLEEIELSLKRLVDSFQTGLLYKNGVRVALVGHPNVGKSSLLNALLIQDKAIITPIAGTTRDVIQGERVIDGIQFHFFDTAGLRETVDVIEKEGIKRALEVIDKADLVLFVCDGSKNATERETELFKLVHHKSTFFVLNKMDLGNKEDAWKSFIEKNNGNSKLLLSLSAKTGLGIDKLVHSLSLEFKQSNKEAGDGYVLNNVRHYKPLNESVQIIERVRINISNTLKNNKINLDEECLIEDLRTISQLLGEVIGEVTSEDVLDQIFSKFCIGK